jgi:glutamate transport system substrate-binding protein
VTALLERAVDAVTTDNLVLAGYAAQLPGAVRLVGKTFSEERYGIGLRKDDNAGRSAVNKALKAMFDRGTWTAALARNFPGAHFDRMTPPLLTEW